MTRSLLLATSSLLAIVAGASVSFAADVAAPPRVFLPVSNPAVSAPNAKIAVFGGSIDGASGFGVDGAVSLPIHDQWGIQIDGLGGSAGGATFWGAGGHLFWRDPTQALVGAYASWVNWSPVGALVGQVGVETEIYHGPLTLAGIVSWQNGTFSGIAGSATATYYLNDNFRIDGGYRFLNGIGNIVSVGAEWQHDTSGLALFAHGSWGNAGYQTVLGGIRFYAGPAKSLIQRNRQDDPPTTEQLNLFHLAPSTGLIVCVDAIDGCAS